MHMLCTFSVTDFERLLVGMQATRSNQRSQKRLRFFLFTFQVMFYVMLQVFGYCVQEILGTYRQKAEGILLCFALLTFQMI